jgi:methylated-DNA-[protein]-cysteine S-methyltransferase
MFEVMIAQHLTPIGWITVTAHHAAVTSITFGQTAQPRGESPIIRQALREIDQYFAGARHEFSVPISFNGTPFQNKVWATLKKIPHGAIPSYSDIADDIGRPSATRAVGMAINKNPIPILIPCHRVIGRDGSLTGYAGGLEIKRRLLDLELSGRCGLPAEIRLDRPATLQLFQ